MSKIQQDFLLRDIEGYPSSHLVMEIRSLKEVGTCYKIHILRKKLENMIK